MHSKATEYTKQLISIPSVSGAESNCLQYLKNWMQAVGLEDITITENFVAGYKKGTVRGDAILLSGHIDTVKVGEGWNTNPWTPTIEQGKLYGIGGSDMKAGVAAQMAAIESVAVPSADTWLVVVANEEVDGSGSAAFVEYFTNHYSYNSTSCVIAEPTGLKHIEVGHRGNAFVELTFKGKAGHGSLQKSYPASALGSAAKFLQNIDNIAAGLQAKYTHAVLGAPTVVPTVCSAGSSNSPNKTAAVMTLMLDIRSTPESQAGIELWLNQICASYGCSWNYAATPVSPCEGKIAAPIVEKVKKAANIHTISASPGATDQIFFESAGIETVVFGPGEFSQAHSQNEWVNIQKIENAAEMYRAIVI